MRILNFIGQGIYHLNKAIPCQDSLISSYQKGRTVLAVSDGCSSSRFSHIASEVAVRAVKDFYSDDRELKADLSAKRALLQFINGRLGDKAEELSLGDMQELYTTLIFAVQEGDKLLVGQIGDGALLAFDNDGRCIYFSAPENVGAKNITYFINSDVGFDKLRMELVENKEIRNIILFSDGPQRFFENQINPDLTKAVREIIDMVRIEKIATEAQLKKYIHGIFGENIYDVYDDWSLIVTDSAYSQRDKMSTEPEIMALYFYELYLKNNPDSEDYVLPVINRIRKALSLEPLPSTAVNSARSAETAVITELLFPIIEPEKSVHEKEEGEFHSYFSDTEILTSFNCNENIQLSSDDEEEVSLQENDSEEEENIFTRMAKGFFTRSRVAKEYLKKLLSERTEENDE